MPSSQPARQLFGLLLVCCVCTQGAVGAVATPQPDAGACFPGVDSIESEETVGDVVELEMLLCFSGSVTVSGPGYTGNASLGDGHWSGGVTVHIDTRLNGSEAFAVTTDRDHTVAMNATGNGSFQPGTYTVTVRGWDDEVVETRNVTLGKPRARDVTVFEAPKGAAAELQSLAAVREAVATSPSDSARRFDDPDTDATLALATNETLVAAVRAGGLEGAMTAESGTPLSRFRAALRAAGGSLTMRQTAETVTPQRQPLSPDLLNSSATHLVPDPDNDTYYLVVDTRELQGEWGGSHGGPVTVGARPGMGYAVRFSMQNGTDAVPSDLVAADFFVVDPAIARLDEAERDDRALRPRANATHRLRTTLAAGTPLTVTVTGLPDGPREQTVRVRQAGNESRVALDLNLSGVPNGTTLRVTAQRDGKPVEGTVTAVVGTTTERTETETPTESATESATERTATFEQTATTTSSTATTEQPATRQPVPGFGVAHGVLGLLLAVLVLRRTRD